MTTARYSYGELAECSANPAELDQNDQFTTSACISVAVCESSSALHEADEHGRREAAPEAAVRA